MVWENVKDERDLNTVYTNDNDVPLYISLAGQCKKDSNSFLDLFVDGARLVLTQDTTLSDETKFNNIFGIVPSGSTYEVKSTVGNTIILWNEARMPVAVGTGGKTVAFRGHLSANQTVVTGVFTKINLDTASIDTDNALVDGKFQPSVAGYYQVNGGIGQACNPTSTKTTCNLYKNGSVINWGSQVNTQTDGSYNSNTSDVIYLNGTTDYLELYGRVVTTGTSAIESDANLYGFGLSTYLSAVLVSGSSASGDSVWAEEDGTATYDGDVEIASTSSIANGDWSGGTDFLKLKAKLGSSFSEPSIAFQEEGANVGGKISTKNVGMGAMSIVFANRAADALDSPLKARMEIKANGRVDIFESLYVNGAPKSVDSMLVDLEKDVKLKDKLIEKLSARLDELEKRG